MSDGVLHVTVAHRPPFVFINSVDVAGTGVKTTFYTGMLIELLDAVLATSNVTRKYELYASPTNAGGTLTPFGWTGVVGELVTGRADVSLFPLTSSCLRTAARLAAIDCTYSYLDQGLVLLVSNTQEGPGALSALEPFQLTLWITLLCTVLAVALIFYGLDLYGRWIRSRQTAALRASGVLTGPAAVRAKEDEDDSGGLLSVSFMAAAGAPERPRRSGWGVQVLYLAYCFFCLIVLSSYTANLTSFLAVRRAAVGVTGLQDLVRGSALLAVNPNGSTAAYFASSLDTLATQLQPRVRYCETPTCVDWVRGGQVAAFVSDRPLLDFVAHQQPCDLQAVGEPFGPGNLVVGLQKGSPLLPLFNDAIQRFSEDGTLTSLHRTWFGGLSQCGDGSAAVLGSDRLGVGQMLGAFVFLLFGALAAFVISNLENLKWCLVRSYATPPSGTSHSGLRSSWQRLSSNLLGVTEMLQVSPDMEPEVEGWGQSNAVAAAAASVAGDAGASASSSMPGPLSAFSGKASRKPGSLHPAQYGPRGDDKAGHLHIQMGSMDRHDTAKCSDLGSGMGSSFCGAVDRRPSSHVSYSNSGRLQRAAAAAAGGGDEEAGCGALGAEIHTAAEGNGGGGGGGSSRNSDGIWRIVQALRTWQQSWPLRGTSSRGPVAASPPTCDWAAPTIAAGHATAAAISAAVPTSAAAASSTADGWAQARLCKGGAAAARAVAAGETPPSGGRPPGEGGGGAVRVVYERRDPAAGAAEAQEQEARKGEGDAHVDGGPTTAAPIAQPIIKLAVDSPL